MRNTSRVRCSTVNWWSKRSMGSTRCTILPACLACGWRVKTTFMPSIVAAPRSSFRPHATAALRDCSIARQNPSCFVPRPQQEPAWNTLLAADDMPGPYTRSKLLAERLAMEAAASGFPVVIRSPTMPIGPHDHNLTPPTAMLRRFLGKRFQFYLDFVVNLVDVRDVAAGLVLAMERGKVGQRYILGGESISLKRLLQYVDTISGRSSLRVPVPGKLAEATAAIMDFMADHVTRTPPSATD